MDVPIAKPEGAIPSTSSQSKKEIKLVLERPSKKEPEQAPDFGTDLPEGVTAANFHQNLFKPITATSKRKKAAKGQATKSQAIGISAMFQTKSPPEPSPTKKGIKETNTPSTPASPKKKIGVVTEGVLQMDFSSEDEPMPAIPNEDTDVNMAEPKGKPKDHPKGMSKYLVIESTEPSGSGESKSFGRRTKKSAPALS